jgi:hypothetical protein
MRYEYLYWTVSCTRQYSLLAFIFGQGDPFSMVALATGGPQSVALLRDTFQYELLVEVKINAVFRVRGTPP